MRITIETDSPHLIASTLWKAACSYRNQATEIRGACVDGVAEGLEQAAHELEQAAASIVNWDGAKIDFLERIDV